MGMCRDQMLAMQDLGGMTGWLLAARNADQMPEKWLNFAVEVGGGYSWSTRWLVMPFRVKHISEGAVSTQPARGTSWEMSNLRPEVQPSLAR
jgi:hypothetical protein